MGPKGIPAIGFAFAIATGGCAEKGARDGEAAANDSGATAAPATTVKGQAFKVDWTGPRSSGDYVDLVKKGHTATSGEGDYFYVGQGDSGELTAPETGEYEIRYILEAPGGRSVVAQWSIRIS